MEFVVEELEEKLKVLVVSKHNFPFVELLKQELKKYGADLFFSSKRPKSYKSFRYCFLVNEHFTQDDTHACSFVYISTGKHKNRHSSSLYEKTKFIECTNDNLTKQDVERILWFVFSRTGEKTLHIHTLPKPKNFPDLKSFFFPWKINITPKRIVFAVLGFIVLFHFFFLIPLSFSYLWTYRTYRQISTENYERAGQLLSTAESLGRAAHFLYAPVRPTYLFFSLAILTDNTVAILDKTQIIFRQALALKDNGSHLQTLILKQNKSPDDVIQVKLRLSKIQNELSELDDTTTGLIQLIPNQFDTLVQTKTNLLNAEDAIHKINKIFPFLVQILENPKEQKFLLFFANNMELRPGGGFLGSFGVLKIRNYTIEPIEVHDVYDADGQLTAHIEPPMPIKKYLNMPHLFLRDSNFSPDFLDDYNRATFFLEKEIGLTGFSGSILLTTTAVQNILGAYGNIYLPDTQETINKDNFYIKTQIHTEQGFFPGSIQKKSFLGSLARQVFIELNRASLKQLAIAIDRSLNEKQMVMYFEIPKLQKLVDSFYWSGRVIEPRCSTEDQKCFVDYLFPYDENVGANKVNYYIQRSFHDIISIDPDGQVNHRLLVRFRNESATDKFPGGTYKNYFQIMLPKNSHLQEITKNGTLVEDISQSQSILNTVGFYLEVPPQKTVEIEIRYSLEQRLNNGNQIYQYIIQKQIGSSSNDYTMELILPKNIYILNQNFAPLVKDNRILYNTSLSSDKIFFIELLHK